MFTGQSYSRLRGRTLVFLGNIERNAGLHMKVVTERLIAIGQRKDRLPTRIEILIGLPGFVVVFCVVEKLLGASITPICLLSAIAGYCLVEFCITGIRKIKQAHREGR